MATSWKFLCRVVSALKAIIFDIDGTLIESMAVDTELYFAAVREVLGPVRIRRDLHDYANVTDSGILAQLLEDNGFGYDGDVVARIRAIFVDGIQQHIAASGPFPAIDGALQFFERSLQANNTGVAIATGGWRRSAMLKLASAGFAIDGIPLVTADDSQSRVDIMRTALAGIGERFESITYFGDAEWDRRACDALGWNFVAVGPGLGGITSYSGVTL